jgi:hypothetical protein
MHCLLERVDTLFYVVADKAYLLDSADLIVDTMRVLFDNATAARSDGGCCYSFILLYNLAVGLGFGFWPLIKNPFPCGHNMPYHRKSGQNYYNFLIYARKV